MAHTCNHVLTGMKPISFPEQTMVVAKNQPPYLPLPAHVKQSKERPVTSCWKGTFRERLVFLFTGRMWVRMLTFSGPLQPVKLSVDKLL